MWVLLGVWLHRCASHFQHTAHPSFLASSWASFSMGHLRRHHRALTCLVLLFHYCRADAGDLATPPLRAVASRPDLSFAISLKILRCGPGQALPLSPAVVVAWHPGTNVYCILWVSLIPVGFVKFKLQVGALVRTLSDREIINVLLMQ